MVKILIKPLPENGNLPLPKPATEFSAGIDLRAAVENTVTIQPGKTMLVPTGIKVAIPNGYEWQIRPRSGIALKYGVTVLNSPGTIDSDYRGPIGVILINHGTEPFVIKRGDRIAQAVLVSVEQMEIEVVSTLSDTIRGEGGFGHSGI